MSNLIGENVSGMQLHVAQNITGQVRGFVAAEKAYVTMSFTEYGVLVTATAETKFEGETKLIPFGNIQSITLNEIDGPA